MHCWQSTQPTSEKMLFIWHLDLWKVIDQLEEEKKVRCSFAKENFPLLVNACFHFTGGALIATKDIQQFPPNLSLTGPTEGTHTYHIYTDYTKQSTHTGQPSLSESCPIITFSWLSPRFVFRLVSDDWREEQKNSTSESEDKYGFPILIKHVRSLYFPITLFLIYRFFVQ